jgi:hypothetical protein
VKVDKIAEEAARLYTEDELSIEAVAEKLGVAYRTARKAIYSQGVEARDPSKRLVGRTRPDKAAGGKRS